MLQRTSNLIFGLVCSLVFSSCGAPEIKRPEPSLEQLQNQVAALTGTVADINSLVNSDFRSCPASGDTADALIRKICRIAQAATAESQTELSSRLAEFANQLQNQLDDINNNLATAGDRLTAAETTIAGINTTLTSLDARMTSAEAAITAINTTLGTVVAGTMDVIQIGTENLAAGPFYESVLRSAARTKINGYVQAFGPLQSLPNNPVTVTNNSNVLVVSLPAHGYVVGDLVELDLLVGSRGFSDSQLQRRFTITATTTNTFTITAPKVATSNGTLGGSIGTVRKVNGEGLAQIWKVADGADSAVRQTTLGGKLYNFVVKANGDICYDKTNNAASFATITAGGTNVVCR